MKQGTLEKIQNLAVSLQLVTIEDMRKHSLPQLVTMIANKLNELMNEVHRFETDVIEMVETQNENIQYLLGEGLHLEVATVFENWMEDGTFDTLINQTALKQVNDRIDETNAQLSAFNKQLRVNINELGVIAGNDDVTDDFTNAINYCVTHNIREIFLPAGIYKLSRTVKTQGVKLVGVGSYIPFLTWDYTSPNGGDLYNHFLEQCSGTIITSSDNITLLEGEINLENIGLFGNRRMTNQVGVLVDTSCNLFNVRIVGFGKCAISMVNGVINPYINKCILEQNGYGIIFGDNATTYTGESNRITIRDSSFNRCENAGIYGVCRGRHFVIDNNTFEAIGEPSDPNRSKPTNYEDTKFAIDLTLKNTGNWTNGSMSITNNYLEETYGFIKLTSDYYIKAVRIENTLWQPYDQTNYSCFSCFSGQIDGLKIVNNNVYTSKDYIKFISYDVKNFETDLQCEYAVDNYHVSDNSGFSRSTYRETSSLAYEVVHKFGEGFIESTSFDSVSYASNKYVGEDGVTYFFFNRSLSNGFDFGPQNTFENYINSGYALIVNDCFVGVIVGLGENLLIVRGNRTGIPIGDGSAKLVKLPGNRVLNAGGGNNKVIYDHDLFPIPFGK